MKKKFCSLISVIAISLSLCGCSMAIDESNSETDTTVPIITETLPPQPYPVIIDNIKIESQPQKIASLSPAITEMLVEMGYIDEICAVGSYCDYPTEIEKLENIGSAAKPNIEKIIETESDLVITNAPIAAKDILKLENNGKKVVFLSVPKSLDDLKNLYIQLGIIVNGSVDGNLYGEEAFNIINKAIKSLNYDKTSDYMYITTDFMIAGKNTFENDILSYFGKNMISTDGYLSYENVDLTLNPKLIFCSNEYSLEELQNNEIISQFDAIKNGNVIFVDNMLFERPSARIIQLIESIESALKTTNSE